jgi:hypothetical protein
MRELVRRLALHMFISLAIVATVHAQSTGDLQKNEVEVRGVYSIPSGDASFSATGTVGSTISFTRDFALDNSLGFALRYTRKSTTGKHKFLVDFGETSWNRSATLSRSFIFLGQTYIANLSASANLKLREFRAMYAYRWGNEKIRFGPMIDAGVVNTRLNISGTTNSGTSSAEASTSTFVATVGYDLDYAPMPKVNIFHSLGVIAYSGEHFFRTEGGVKYFPAQHFGLSGGYRFARYKQVDNLNFVRVRTNGPFFGGVLRF